MGIAIIWVIFYHYGLYPENGIISYLIANGYGGVDIFIFASGLGCYYSLEKNSNSADFLKKRFWRIMPTYWVLITVWCLYHLKDGLTWRQILGNFLCVQNLTEQGGEFNWYMNAIWVYYILAPTLKSIADKMNRWYQHAIAIIILCLISIPFWHLKYHIIIISRLPIFFIGMCFAKCSEDYSFKKIGIALCTIPIAFGILLLAVFYKLFPDVMWACGCFWYPFILITPALCILLSYVSTAIEKTKIGSKIIRGFVFIGTHSLPIYLTHEFVRTIIMDYNFFNLSYYPLMLFGLLLLPLATLLLSSLGTFSERILRRAFENGAQDI
jgi:Predicted acyltransferases